MLPLFLINRFFGELAKRQQTNFNMKKMFFLMVLITYVSLLTTSCSTVSKTGLAAPIAYTEVLPDVIKAEFDFNLKRKKTGKANAWYLFNFWKIAGSNKFSEIRGGETKPSLFGGRIAKIKSAAIYNALEGSNGDIIIAPQYDTEIVTYLFGLLKSYKVAVKGYEGRIRRLYQVKDGQNVTVNYDIRP
jgi:hypothetical protein